MDELADVPCRAIPWEQRSGPMNMALDVVAARRATEDGIGTIRTYGWEPSTLSLGYAQDAATVDWESCREMGLSVTRRPTGGGAILHESWGDVAYSIVLPADALPGDLMDAYRLLCRPVIDAFSRLNLDVTFAETEEPALFEPACYLRDIHPAHDLVGSGPATDGKISGNAQYRQRDAVIQHGSLRFDYDPNRMLGCFIDTGLTGSDVRERVATIRELGVERLETVVEALDDTLVDTFDPDERGWADSEIAAGETLVRRKFGNDRWIRERSDPLAAPE